MIYIRFLKQFLISIFTFQVKLKYSNCPFCVKKRIFLSMGKEPYKTRCLTCKGTLISLSVIKTIVTNSINLDHTYELSFHGVLFDFLKKNSKKFTFSEYFPTNKSRYVNGIRNEDVQRLTFNSESFDLITTTEVFEHVPNYLKGFKEVYRALKKDSFFCFTVPIFRSSKQICKLHQDGSLLWLGPEEFHGSRLTGDNSVPVFWHHSRGQILKDLVAIGFKEVRAINHLWFDEINQIVFLARK